MKEDHWFDQECTRTSVSSHDGETRKSLVLSILKEKRERERQKTVQNI